jgi:hypothetical protein
LDDNATLIDALIDEFAEPLELHGAGGAEGGNGQQAVCGLVEVADERIGERRWKVTFRRPGTNGILHADTGDLNSAGTRSRMIERVVALLGSDASAHHTLEDELEGRLLQAVAANGAATSGQAAPDVGVVEYESVVDPDNPEATGFYAVGERFRQRLTNLVMLVEEDRIIGDVDEGEETRRFSGTIQLAGVTSRFDVSSAEFADDLKAVIFDAAGSRVELMGSIDTIRTAISRNSRPTIRRYLTSPGWSSDRSQYLVPGGYVDREGYHAILEGDGVAAIDFSGHEKSKWLGLRNLDPEELRRTKRHLIDDLMGINDRNVVSAVLAGVVMAIVMRPAGIDTWPLLWLEGLTGSGKSLLACMAMNFFGDFGAPGSGRYLSWNSTPSSLQSAGYDFRDALYVLDDYKRDGVRHANCVMVLQSYADRTGRSRLRADSTMNTTRPIRGLLLSTGEDFPESNASGRGRAVVIRVSSPERRFDRVERCQAQCHLYRGWTAAFIAHVIRNDLGARFKTRVDHRKREYLRLIAGRTNDARIATNHACLAAAFELFAEFMADVWPEAAEAAEAFAGQYVAGLVVEAAGAVEEETPAHIFLGTLVEQLAFGRVRIEGVGPSIGPDDTQEKRKVVGRLGPPGGRHLGGLSEATDAHFVELSIPLSLAEVQEQLRRQGRQELRIGERALIDQLAALGCLVDADYRPIAAGDGGKKTHKSRIDGKSMNAARVKATALRKIGGADDQPERHDTGTSGPSPMLPFPDGEGAVGAGGDEGVGPRAAGPYPAESATK